MPGTRVPASPKPNLLRRLGRDQPGLYEFQLRVREKARLEARRLPFASRRRRPSQTSHPPVSPLNRTALLSLLDEMGIRRSDLVMVHSSWERSRALAPSPIALIEALHDAVGAQGTVCMPSYPPSWTLREKGFDVRRSPSQAGLLTEVFRRLPDVERSLQQRSVAARGPLARELTSRHHLSPYASGLDSPYGQLATREGKLLFLGVGLEANTMFHCGEDVLEDQFPVRVYEEGPFTFEAVDSHGHERTVLSYERAPRWTYCCDVMRMAPYFEDLFVVGHVGPTQLMLFEAAPFLERLLALARAGVHMYGFYFPPAPRSA